MTLPTDDEYRAALRAERATGMRDAAMHADEYHSSLVKVAAAIADHGDGVLAERVNGMAQGYAELSRRIHADANELEAGK